MTRSMIGKRRVSHTASRRCNKNAIIVFHWIFDFMMNQLKKNEKEKRCVDEWDECREWGARSCKTSIYNEIRQKRNNDDTHVVRILLNDTILGVLFFFIFFLFILHLISPQPFMYCSSTDLA